MKSIIKIYNLEIALTVIFLTSSIICLIYLIPKAIYIGLTLLILLFTIIVSVAIVTIQEYLLNKEDYNNANRNGK